MAVTGWIKPLLCCLLTAGLAACTGQSVRPEDPVDLTAGGKFEAWSDTPPRYRIGEGDKLHVSFMLTPELDEDVLVRPDGMATLQAAGEVSLAALSVKDAAAAIADAAQRRLRNPDVQIAVLDPQSARIYVGGEVKTPGAYPLNSGPVTVFSALQTAGGASDTARLDEVILIRRAPDDRPMLRLVNVRAMLEGRDPQQIRLYQGDIVFVPKTRIAEFDLWIDQFVNKALPFSRSFGYSIGRSTSIVQ